VITSRAATTADLDAATETITTSFHLDPIWSWAFPDPDRRPEQYRVFWRLLIGGVLRYDWVRVTDGCESVAVWIPPGGTELPEGDEEKVEPLLTDLLGEHAPAVMELLARFEEAQPRAEPHYYLSLLGTHDDHRGKGIGMALLEENLALIDAEHMPAYLESTNPVNLGRYGRVGFVPIGEFSAPDGPTATTMWRAAR
jgi:GNAT superfamily N-acetyltransferase